MDLKLSDFIIISKQINGIYKVSHDSNNLKNIFKFLYEQGYRKTKLLNKIIYYKRDGSNLIPSSLYEIRCSFKELLENNNFPDIPEDFNRSLVMNWYYDKRPIKNNFFLNHYLFEEINEIDKHNLLLKTDVLYKHQTEINIFLTKLNEWKFKKTIDISSLICPNAPLYFKKIEQNKFLIFSHYNSQNKIYDGFDCLVANFENEKHIGKKIPSNIETIQLSFQLDQHFNLISSFIF